jgi:hypothetical protein
MSDTLLVFQSPVLTPNGTAYEARACGSEVRGGGWQGWLEFVPVAGGAPVRSQRETTQPNRVDTEYWATGLTMVYLEGALTRALTRPLVVPVAPPQPSVFRGPVPSVAKRAAEVSPASVLDPFSLYVKGEPLLRSRLGALSAWHLVTIAIEYELTDEPVERLNRLSAPNLIELIVRGTREEVFRHGSA